MKILILVVTLLFASFVTSAQQASSETPSKFAARIGKAFEKKNLGTLDGTRPVGVKVVIEHSLGEGKDATVTRSFSSLKKAQAWMTKQMISEATFSAGKPDGCRRSKCEFTQENGMLHNHLYLSAFAYGTLRGKLFIKTLWMIDGD